MRHAGRLSSALASVEAEIYATTPFAVLGLVSPAADGRVTFDMRSRLAVTRSVLKPEELPEPLRRCVGVPLRVSGASTAPQAASKVDLLFAMLELESLVAVPLNDEGGLLFAASATPDTLDDTHVAAATDLARRLAAMPKQEDTPSDLERRLMRFDALSPLLPTLGAALDVREVFDQLSAIAGRVLPHDSALVGLFTGDSHKVRLHAISMPASWQLPEIVDNPYPDPLTESFEFAIHRDLAAHPLERSGPAVRVGLRSALRVAIRFHDRVGGVLAFSSFATDRYRDADIEVAERIASYVTLALSHQRLADDAREAAAVRERAANLEMLDGLLKTLAGVLDVREVFDRVSEICDKVMTHDAMSISIPTADGRHWIIHVATGALSHLATPFEMAATPTPRLLESHWDYELVSDMAAHAKYDGTPSVNAGLRALLSIPVWVEGCLRATVNFYSRTPGHFTTDDVMVTRRIADHIALALSHQRLAEESRRTAELRRRTARLDLLDELLATVTDSGDLPDAFDRVSAIANKVLAHDVLVLTVLLPDRANAKIYARSGFEGGNFPDILPVPAEYVANDRWEHDLVDDVYARPDRRDSAAAKAGYRSAIRVPIRFDGKFAAALGFLSRAPSVYTRDDVPVARRIADRISLVLSRERGADAIRRAEEADARAAALESRVRALTEELDARTGYRRVIGQSPSWRHALTQAAQVAATDTTVLLLGESGTGKEVVARFLHRASPRSDGPFLALNCAALPEHLLEAELFGYERGAFTGATQSKPGQLEQAAGGTLLLDEVGEMSLPAQAKFLRVLQEREFQRLGGTRVQKTDARIVAATNRDLARAIEQGTFREDLFYRLNVFAIRLPALRDRRDDILALSEAFLAEIARGLGRPPSGISRDARARLLAYHWPGNVRELRNILERAAILCEGGLITEAHLAVMPPRPAAAPAPSAAAGAVPATAAPPPTAPAGDLKSMERKLIEEALENARFNKSQAAKALGLTRAQLYVRMRRYGLE